MQRTQVRRQASHQASQEERLGVPWQSPGVRKGQQGTAPRQTGEGAQPDDSGLGELPSARRGTPHRSEEHTSELQSLMRISYAVFCLKKKKHTNKSKQTHQT